LFSQDNFFDTLSCDFSQFLNLKGPQEKSLSISWDIVFFITSCAFKEVNIIKFLQVKALST